VRPTGGAFPPTGLFFHEQSASAICAAITDFEACSDLFDPIAICQHAQSFSIDNFKTEFQTQVNQALDRYAPPWLERA
jgi:hypothetical protein